MSIKYYLYNFFGYNLTIFHYINSLANNSFISKISLILSYLFSFAFISLTIIIPYILLIIYFYFKENKDKFPIKSKFINVLGLNYIAAVIILTILKHLLSFQRPICELHHNLFIAPYPYLSKVCEHSLPSAHSAFACLLLLSLWPYTSILPRILLILLLLITCASRIVLAMHYPADILYGILCAIFINFIVSRVINSLYKSNVKS